MDLEYPITTDLLAVISLSLKKQRSLLQKTCSLTIPQFRVLSCLEQQEGVLHLHDVAELLESSSSTTTYVIDRLEEDELVRRRTAKDNRRVVEIELLPAGSALAQKSYGLAIDLMNEMLAPLGDYLKNAANQGIKSFEDNYSSLVDTHRYFASGSVFNTFVLYDTRIAAILKNDELSTVEFRVLFELESRLRDMWASDLARLLLTKGTDITVACNKLENKGLIIRRQSNRDRRAVEVGLSPEGYQMVKRVAPKVDKMFVNTVIELDRQGRDMLLKAATIVAKDQRKRFLYN